MMQYKQHRQPKPKRDRVHNRSLIIGARVMTCLAILWLYDRFDFGPAIIGVRAPSDLGVGATFLPEKNYAMPESVRVEIGMQTQTFTIFASNETAIIGKTVKLKACILNSINSLNVI